MKTLLPKLPFFTVVFLFLSLFFANMLCAQITGDYRSVGIGNWTALSSWQYYNGTAWVTPSGTSPQGYPGQFTGTGTVTIRNGSNITISTSTPNNFSSLVVGEGTSGVLTVDADIDVLTLNVKINASALVKFSGNNEIRFPSNTSILIDAPGKFDDNGTCNNNVAVYLGSVKFAVCNGSGNSEYTFDQVNSSGGTLVATVSSISPVCQNSTINLFGSYSGIAGKTTSEGLTSGVNYSWSIKDPNNVITTSSSQNPNFTASLSGNYSVTLTCGTYFGTALFTNSKTISVVVNDVPVAPVKGSIKHPDCLVATGSVPLSGLPTTGPWTITAIPNTTSLTGLTGSGATTTIGGLAQGISYTFSVSNGTCTSTPTASVIVNSVVTTTSSDGVNWSSPPTLLTAGIITAPTAAPISLKANTELCSCTVSASTNLTVNSGITLKLQDKLTVNGTLIFENNSSLVQINDNANNTGNITYRRSNSTSRETDYTYWSSPVAGQILKNVSIKTPSDFFYSFNAVADDWNQEDSANVMAVGRGYIIRGPYYATTPPPGFHEAPFQGVPNNGLINVAIPSSGGETSNLIGNPYPSALDTDLFLKTNSSVLEGTLYFWTHNTAIGIGVSNPGTGVYAYSSDDYATYNLTGGTATRIGNFVGAIEQTSNKPNGKIAAGQGFFATGKATGGNIIFNNTMRVSGGTLGVNNSQFFKTNNTKSKTTSSVEKHRVWLNLTNAQGAFKQMLVGYITDATNGYDNAFDGQSFDGNEFVDFYSINDNKNLTIQGRALPFDKNDEVALGYSSTIEGAFSISIDQVDGILASEGVFIEDKTTNTIKNLKEGAYNFSTKAGSFNDRFVLRYTDKTLGTGDFDKIENQVLISKDKNELKIKSEAESIERITVFDLLGRKVFDKETVNSNEFSISNNTLNKQIVIIKVILTNGNIISKKVIY